MHIATEGRQVLVLTRKPDQSIMVGDDIEITVLEVRGEQVRLGIRAPRTVAVHRKEVFEQIQQGNRLKTTRNGKPLIRIFDEISAILINHAVSIQNHKFHYVLDSPINLLV